MSTPELVTDQRRLEVHCRRWRRIGRFAFDTEFIRDDTYDARLCLIQVTTDGQVVLVDPTAGVNVNAFWELVADAKVATIVHAGKEDFEVCLRATGQPPHNVFDVQIAAGLVGYNYPLSLARLVHAVLGRRIAKGQTLTDWLRRPLTDEQVRYAAEDVVYLPALHQHLRERLEETGRESWAAEEFAAFEDPSYYKRTAQLSLFRLKGAKKLDAAGLAILERLIGWRDQWARTHNRPTRAMMRDDVLVTIAKRRPRQASDLEILRGFPQSRKSKVVQEILELIEAATATPRSAWPAPFKHRETTPMTKAVLDMLSAFARAVCHAEAVSHDLVGSAQRLRELLDYLLGESQERPLLLRGWREEFIGRRLVDLLEGRSELHLSGWPNDPQLEIVSRPKAAKR